METLFYLGLAYLLIGYTFSVIIHAGLTNEWSFFVAYGDKEEKLSEDEIEEIANHVIWLWPIIIVFMLIDKILRFRTRLARYFERKRK